MQLGEKYKTTSDLKKFVVLPTVKDINDFSNLKVDIKQIKRGKEIVKFIFKYEPKKIEQPKITKAYIEKYARPGESYDQARDRLRKQQEAIK